MAKILRENLNLKVYSILKEMIFNYRFKPGERINVEKITKELDVSRTPVWEAMRRLENEHLVVNIPNKGVFMNTLSIEEALDLFKVREVLEVMVARLAALNIDETTLDKLERSLKRQKELILDEDIITYTKEDFNFHTLIYEASGNSFLKELLAIIKNKIHPIGIHAGEFLPTFLEDHTMLIQSLKDHDQRKAENVFRQHNQNVMRVIRGGDLKYMRPE